MKKPLLIVIAGPNGSGKTSITNKILQHHWIEECEYINPDNIANETFGDWNNNKAVMDAAKLATEMREKCIAERKSLIFETVLSAKEKIDFLEKAKLQGYFIRIFFVGTDNPSINAARITKRVMDGGHDVPISKVISRYSKSIANCCICSKFSDRTYVFDNSIEFKDPELLFKVVDGKVTKEYNEINKWAMSIFNYLRK
jgi:predicted ABC-type ATPase